jgi:hypothetical protein
MQDEVARMIRSGVTALFETGKTEVTDEEIDILLGRKEGTVDNTLTEADEEKTHQLWQAKDEMSLQDVDVRMFDGVTYNKTDDWTKAKGPDKGGVDLNDLVSGTRKRKQRTVMVDGKGTGYGASVPVLASEMLQEVRKLLVCMHRLYHVCQIDFIMYASPSSPPPSFPPCPLPLPSYPSLSHVFTGACGRGEGEAGPQAPPPRLGQREGLLPLPDHRAATQGPQALGQVRLVPARLPRALPA